MENRGSPPYDMGGPRRADPLERRKKRKIKKEKKRGRRKRRKKGKEKREKKMRGKMIRPPPKKKNNSKTLMLGCRSWRQEFEHCIEF